MRITRRNALLLVIVGALGAWSFLAQSSAASDPTTEFVFPRPIASNSVSFESADDNSTATLERVETGWLLKATIGGLPLTFPAYGPAIERWVGRLEQVRATELVAESSDSFEKLGLGPGARVELTTDRARVWIGQSGGELFVAEAGGDRAYRLATGALPSRDLNDWIDPQPLRFDPSIVDHVEFGVGASGGEPPMILERSVNGSWSAVGGTASLSSSVMSDWLTTVSSLVVEELLPQGEPAPREPVLVLSSSGRVLARIFALEPPVDAVGTNRRWTLEFDGEPLGFGADFEFGRVRVAESTAARVTAGIQALVTQAGR